MKLTQWREVLASEPLTDRQLGAVHGAFRRLGFQGDRAERLRLTAALAGCSPIGSTKDLTMGEGGRVIRALDGCRTVRDLYALAESEPEPERSGLLAALVTWLRS